MHALLPHASALSLFLFYGLQIALSMLLEPFYEQHLRKNAHSLATVLTDEWSSRASGQFSQFVEYMIMNRYSMFGYKNSARANTRILSSTLLTLQLFLWVWFLEDTFGNGKVSKEMQGVLAGFFFSSFVLERKMLHDKWSYLTSIQNEIEKQTVLMTRRILETKLAIDLVVMEMWSHRSFRHQFSKVAVKSFSTYKGEYPFKINNLGFVRYDLDQKILSKEYIQTCLMNYQGRLTQARDLEDSRLELSQIAKRDPKRELPDDRKVS